jgi:predicted dithiol-disulfide oxidoreductase (DUF899 family)
VKKPTVRVLQAADGLDRHGDCIYHTYSTSGRNGALLIGIYNWLDLTPFGRQEGQDAEPLWQGTILDLTP